MNDEELADIISFAKRNSLMRLPFMAVFYAYKSLNKHGTTRKN